MKRTELGFTEFEENDNGTLERTYKRIGGEDEKNFNKYFKSLYSKSMYLDIRTDTEPAERVKQLYEDLKKGFKDAFSSVAVVTEDIISCGEDEGLAVMKDKGDNIALIEPFLDEDTTTATKMYIYVQRMEDMTDDIRDFVGENYKNLLDVIYAKVENYDVNTSYCDLSDTE